MKRLSWIILCVLILLGALSAGLGPFIASLAKRQIKDIFTGSSVSVLRCALNPFSRLCLYGIQIQRQGLYGINIKELQLRYTWLSLFKGIILRVYLKDAAVKVNLPDDDWSALASSLKQKPSGAFAVSSLELSGFNCDLESKGIFCQARVSAVADVKQQMLHRLSLKVDKLGAGDFHLQGLSLELNQKAPGLFEVAEIKYRKTVIAQLRGETGLKGKDLSAVFSARLLGGGLRGDIHAALDKGWPYSIDLKFIDSDISRIVDEFDLAEKFQMSGSLAGIATLKGTGLSIRTLDGRLSLPSPGGSLTIKDNQFLQRLAGDTQQPLEILVESFKNYRYNIGKAFLGLEGGDLIFTLALEGQAGKRDLTVTLHNFKLSH